MVEAAGTVRRGPRRLSRAGRAEVIRHAQRGRGHPDVRLARAALRWARRRRRIRQAVALSLQTVLPPVAGVAAMAALPDPGFWMRLGIVLLMGVVWAAVVRVDRAVPSVAAEVEVHSLAGLAEADDRSTAVATGATATAGPGTGHPRVAVPGHPVRIRQSRWALLASGLPAAALYGTGLVIAGGVLDRPNAVLPWALLGPAVTAGVTLVTPLRLATRREAAIYRSGLDVGGIHIPWDLIVDVRSQLSDESSRREPCLFFRVTSAADVLRRVPLDRDQRRLLAKGLRGDPPGFRVSCAGLRSDPLDVLHATRTLLAARSARAAATPRTGTAP